MADQHIRPVASEPNDPERIREDVHAARASAKRWMTECLQARQERDRAQHRHAALWRHLPDHLRNDLKDYAP